MVVDYPILPFFEWLLPGDAGLGSLLKYVATVLLVAAICVFGAFLIAAIRNGPARATRIVSAAIRSGIRQLVDLSPRRAWAMAKLAFQEAIRRRVLIALAVLAVLFLFAGWFLNPSSDAPAEVYISFVLTATGYLVALLALLLSVFSLPTDIKSATITTVVTKPVRTVEIVLGRILGFGLMGSLLVLVMGVCSYIFVVRGLSHSHALSAEAAEALAEAPLSDDPAGIVRDTTRNARHHHEVHVDEEGRIRTSVAAGHWHDVLESPEGDPTAYRIGPHRGMLMARVPVYGKLRFLNRSGKPAEAGVNTGDEWMYHSYIEGGTLAAAIWTFEGVAPLAYDSFGDGLPLELNLQIFRTHKGDVRQGIRGSIVLKNPDPKQSVQSEPILFTGREHVSDLKVIPRSLRGQVGNDKRDIDLFTDLVHEGRIEVWVRCSERGQFFGLAERDTYLRANERSFASNFAKGFVNIWMQMLIVVSFGVLFSTFLSGPMAFMATVSTVMVGYFTQNVRDVASGAAVGGGPLESLYRIVRQDNLVSPLEPGVVTSILQKADAVYMFLMDRIVLALPDFQRLGVSSYVAEGYNITGNQMAQQMLLTLGYAAALTCLGYFILKTREVSG